MLNELLKKTFLAELEEIIEKDNFLEPNVDSTSHENVVGEMNTLEKALYTLYSKKNRLSRMIKLNLNFENNSENQKKKLELAFFELIFQSQSLKKLMFSLIEERFNTGNKNIGIRSGFSVVWYDDENRIQGLLSTLFSGPSGDFPD